MSIRSRIRSIQRRLNPYAPLIEISISKSAILHNLHAYQSRYPQLRFAPVLKSNAYGHGLTTIAKILDHEDVPFFMVDSLYEARQLRHAGIRTRIVVMGYVRPRDMIRARLKDVEFAIVAFEQLRELSRAHKPLKLHLKLDTGMHRQGITHPDLPDALRLLEGNPALTVTGVCSHFGDADGEVESRTKEQVALYKEMSRAVLDVFPLVEFTHLAATKGVRFAEEAGTNVVRLGIGLYGIDTSHHSDISLKPVLSMTSSVSSVRTLYPGDWVGYSATYVADTERRVATVPAGYYEGVDRALSNTGFMQVAGVACPIIGRVSMNMSTIDVSSVEDVQAGDAVTVISRSKEDRNSIERMAELADTTPYVILTHLPSHLRRIVER
jgi:alanine racemase